MLCNVCVLRFVLCECERSVSVGFVVEIISRRRMPCGYDVIPTDAAMAAALKDALHLS